MYVHLLFHGFPNNHLLDTSSFTLSKIKLIEIFFKLTKYFLSTHEYGCHILHINIE